MTSKSDFRVNYAQLGFVSKKGSDPLEGMQNPWQNPWQKNMPGEGQTPFELQPGENLPEHGRFQDFAVHYEHGLEPILELQ